MSNTKESTDTLILESSLDLCTKIRGELVMKFDFCWFLIYTKNAKSTSACIMGANAFGGKMDKKTADAVIAFAKEAHDRLKS